MHCLFQCPSNSWWAPGLTPLLGHCVLTAGCVSLQQIPRNRIAGYAEQVHTQLLEKSPQRCPQWLPHITPTSNRSGFFFIHTRDNICCHFFLDDTLVRVANRLSEYWYQAFPWWLTLLSTPKTFIGHLYLPLSKNSLQFLSLLFL